MSKLSTFPEVTHNSQTVLPIETHVKRHVIRSNPASVQYPIQCFPLCT